MLFKRIFVFVDGSNLHHRLRQVLRVNGPLPRFDYRSFVDSVLPHEAIVRRSYYVGVFHKEREYQFFEKQRRFLQYIQNEQQGFVVRPGMMRKQGNQFEEKGVDVLLAIDLVIGAARDEYDVAVLVSSDSDLVPAIEFVRSCGKQVIYVAFESRRTIAISKLANKTVVFTQAQLAQFLHHIVPVQPKKV